MPQSHQTPQQLLLPAKKYTLKKEKTLKTSIPPDTPTAFPPAPPLPLRHPPPFSPADRTSVKRDLLEGQKRPTICGLLRACPLNLPLPRASLPTLTPPLPPPCGPPFLPTSFPPHHYPAALPPRACTALSIAGALVRITARQTQEGMHCALTQNLCIKLYTCIHVYI